MWAWYLGPWSVGQGSSGIAMKKQKKKKKASYTENWNIKPIEKFKNRCLVWKNEKNPTYWSSMHTLQLSIISIVDKWWTIFPGQCVISNYV